MVPAGQRGILEDLPGPAGLDGPPLPVLGAPEAVVVEGHGPAFPAGQGEGQDVLHSKTFQEEAGRAGVGAEEGLEGRAR